jgi:ABC-type branched-subunit amino acid transport system substrate-binding protein
MYRNVLLSSVLFLSGVDALAEETPRHFKVGMISILTGQYSDVGQGIANAGELAVEDYNKAHPDDLVGFLLEDDGADPKKAITAYNKLKDIDKADIILPISTFAITSLRGVVSSLKRPTLIIGNEPYEPVDDNIYMLSPAPGPAYVEYGKYIAKEVPSGAIAIVASQNEVFFRMAKAVQEGVGGSRSEIIEIPPGDTDLTSIALMIKSKGIQSVVFNAFPVEMAKVVKGLLRINSLPKNIFLDETIDNSIDDIKAVLGDDCKVLHGADRLKLSSALRSEFVAKYQKKFGLAPTSWSDYGYDAVALALFLRDKPLAEAREWLRTNSYEGMSGKIEFDAVGLRKPQFEIGKFEIP